MIVVYQSIAYWESLTWCTKVSLNEEACTWCQTSFRPSYCTQLHKYCVCDIPDTQTVCALFMNQTSEALLLLVVLSKENVFYTYINQRIIELIIMGIYSLLRTSTNALMEIFNKVIFTNVRSLEEARFKRPTMLEYRSLSRVTSSRVLESRQSTYIFLLLSYAALHSKPVLPASNNHS